MLTINIIGAGAVGQTLAALLVREGLVEVQQIVNQSRSSAERAAASIGQGSPVDSINDLSPADVHLVGTNDDSIESVTNELAAGVSLDGAVVFHCSGSSPSSLLKQAKAKGACIASVHPIKSFANVQTSLATFPGTFCGVEGDDRAMQILDPLFTAIGARTLRIEPESKTLYHAAIVFAMNYFIALVDVGLRCYEKAGIERETALELLQPILAGAASNVVRFGPVDALTGPIARGDVGVVQRQMSALGDWDKVESPEGISPSGSHRSGRDSLPSSGSCHPSNGNAPNRQ